MDWTSTTVLEGPCARLGRQEGDIYIPSPGCTESLYAIERQLALEDLLTRNVRRNLSLAGIVHKDLVPILIHAKDASMLCTVTRLLVNLTMPVECLLPVRLTLHSKSGRETIRQLQKLLIESKRAFLDDRATTAIVRAIRNVLHQTQFAKGLSQDECIHVNNLLLLLRNILHMPDHLDSTLYPTSHKFFKEWQAMQNKLVWNLFAQGLDIALLLVITNQYKIFWAVTMVQLIALLYKDQNISEIQNLLSKVANSSDSSDDEMESETSKHSCDASHSISSSDSSKHTASTDTKASDSGFQKNDSHTGSSPHRRHSSNSSSPSVNSSLFDSKNTSLTSSFEDNSDGNGDKLTMLGHNSSCKLARDGMKYRCHLSHICSTDESSGYKSDNNIHCEEVCLALKDCKISHSANTLNAVNKRKDLLSTESSMDPNAVNKWRVMESIRMETQTVTSDLDASMKSSSSDEELKEIFKTELNSPETRNSCAKQKQHAWAMKHARESDSSNDDDDAKSKPRSHPPVGWKHKSASDGKYQLCSSSVCLDAALEAAARKGRSATTKESVLEKRRKVRLLGENLLHCPSNDDISRLLRDFTLSFLHNGFSELVLDLKNVIITASPLLLDKSHLFWLITYFLRLASSLPLPYHHVSCILSSDMISYLTFEGILMCEDLELMFCAQPTDVQPLLGRMHLLVTALREIFAAIESYCKKLAARKDKMLFQKLRVQIAQMADVRQLFLLLIRKYKCNVQSKQYLIDIISTNHTLLLLLEKVYMDPSFCQHMDMPAHIEQFGTAEVMEQYGIVLEDFRINSEFVNDCIFTMMHHVAGSVGASPALFRPIILKSFCSIIQEEFKVSEIWEELLNQVMREFVRTTQRSNSSSTQKLFSLMTIESQNGISSSSYSVVNSDTSSESAMEMSQHQGDLYWWYLQYEHHRDPVGKIREGLMEKQILFTREQISQKLLSQGLISKTDYDFLQKKDQMSREDDTTPKDGKSVSSVSDSLYDLLREMTATGHKEQIQWLQRALLEACYVRPGFEETENQAEKDPVPYYSQVLNRSIPLVAFNQSQEQALQSELFVHLLHCLGFHLAADVGRLYPRIPSFWTADAIYSVAQCLGPCAQTATKLTVQQLEQTLKSKTNPSEEMINDEHASSFQRTSAFFAGQMNTTASTQRTPTISSDNNKKRNGNSDGNIKSTKISTSVNVCDVRANNDGGVGVKNNTRCCLPVR